VTQHALLELDGALEWRYFKRRYCWLVAGLGGMGLVAYGLGCEW